ncbi:MAG: DUF4167 domain-containing protein [Alphaproteobacteria bacterium]|nr:DUF4167 domain-containing protein [Alphaproteobacteria bacterium]
MKRQRGRGRGGKPAGNHPNRNFESSGPDLKIRGSAAHIYEKYLQLARDAQSSGDRVMAENYLQHAEHYFRILRAMQPQHVSPQFEQRFDQTYDLEPEDGEEGEDGEMDGPEEDGEIAAQGGEEGRGQHQQRQRFEGPRGEQRGGGQHRGDRRQGGFREQREPREPREHREPREAREPREPREGGFSGQPHQGGQASGAPAGGAPTEGEFAGEGEGDFRGRRRRRGRFRPMNGEGGGEGRPPREGGEQPSVEGFGDSAPAFLGGD